MVVFIKFDAHTGHFALLVVSLDKKFNADIPTSGDAAQWKQAQIVNL